MKKGGGTFDSRVVLVPMFFDGHLFSVHFVTNVVSKTTAFAGSASFELLLLTSKSHFLFLLYFPTSVRLGETDREMVRHKERETDKNKRRIALPHHFSRNTWMSQPRGKAITEPSQNSFPSTRPQKWLT